MNFIKKFIKFFNFFGVVFGSETPLKKCSDFCDFWAKKPPIFVKKGGEGRFFEKSRFFR